MLAADNKLLTANFGVMSFNSRKVVDVYKTNIIYSGIMELNQWLAGGSNEQYRISSLDLIILGGSYVSAENKKRISEYLKEHGLNTGIANGYGLSEASGACIYAPADREDDTIGFPLPGVTIKIYDEEAKKYYSYDGEHTGVLYIHSDALSSGRIDDTTYFNIDEIDGLPYICTFDAVRINKDKSLSYTGRANRFFVNNEGIRFDAGLVETSVSAQHGIDGCAIIPAYDKGIHDTVPVLSMKTTAKNDIESLAIVRQALIQVFIKDNKIGESNLPEQCILTNELAYITNGKIDIYRLTSGEIDGRKYRISAVRPNKK